MQVYSGLYSTYPDRIDTAHLNYITHVMFQMLALQITVYAHATTDASLKDLIVKNTSNVDGGKKTPVSYEKMRSYNTIS